VRKGPCSRGRLYPPRDCIEAAQWRLLEAAQRKLESLMAEKRTVQRVLGTERNLLVVLWPLQEAPGAAYDRDYLPVLSTSRSLARLYLLESHCKDHDGQDSMVMWSRRHSSQETGRGDSLPLFRLQVPGQRCGEQLMAPLPAHRMGPVPR
jgi:hypothetical protein